MTTPGACSPGSTDADGDTTAAFTHDQGATIMPGVGTILSVREGDDSRFVHTDVQGTTRKVTSAAEAVIAAYDLDAFGVQRSHTGAYSTRYLFTGKERDPGPSLDYFIARQYKAWRGVFLSKDPVGPGEGWYLYVRGRPIARMDPEGTRSIWDPPPQGPYQYADGCCAEEPTPGGNTWCDPDRGGVAQQVGGRSDDPKGCVVPCAYRHEAVHAHDLLVCCTLYIECLSAADGDADARARCDAAYEQWVGNWLDPSDPAFDMDSWWNHAYTECRAEAETLRCLREQWSKYHCHRVGPFPSDENTACLREQRALRLGPFLCVDDCCSLIAAAAAMSYRMRRYWRCDEHPQSGWNTWCQF